MAGLLTGLGALGAMIAFFSSDQLQLMVAGLLGGLVRWATLKEPWRQGLMSLVVGTVCARYLGPLSVPILEPIVGKLTADPQATIGLSGFVIGVGGIAVSGFVLDIWNAKRRQVKRDEEETSRRRRRRHDDEDRAPGGEP